MFEVIGKKRRKVLMILYILNILCVTILSREAGAVRVFRGLFREVRMGFWRDFF